MDKIYLDTNFLLDLALENRPDAASAAELFDRVAEGKAIAVVSPSSLKGFYYVARRGVDEAIRRNWIALFIDTFDVASFDRETCQAALDSSEPDFEDGLMLASAQHEACDCIISRDENAFASSQIEKLTAREYLRKH